MERLKTVYTQICEHLEKGLLPFWAKRSIDDEFGGYFTYFDNNGEPSGITDKYLVQQTRMIWSFSAAYNELKNPEFLKMARIGYNFFIKHFWDAQNGGWYWSVNREGEVLNKQKVVYGHSFAIYALSEFAIASGEIEPLQYAEITFDILHLCAADIKNGGYIENFTADWIPEDGQFSGEIKTLNTHMHLMEAYTTLAKVSKKTYHIRRLSEITDLILRKMVDYDNDCGFNRFDEMFNTYPDKINGEEVDVTSYGHNVELAWLLNKTAEVLGHEPFTIIAKMMCDNALDYGYDYENGGVYFTGTNEGVLLSDKKSWWQNAEALIGFLDCYQLTGEQKYLDVFVQIWDFSRKFLISPLGEWYLDVKKDGSTGNQELGQNWKTLYHTGRAAIECKQRLEKILEIK